MMDETAADGPSGGSLPALLVSVGLCGAYVVLFGLATWTTYQRNSVGNAWIRIPLLLMLLDLTAVLALAVVDFKYSEQWQSLPLQIGINVATCIAGLLSDGLLAWRAFVIFGRQSWMKWVLTIVILSNFAAGSLANIAYMYEIRTRKLEFEDAYNIGAIMKIYPLALQGSTAAAWLIDAWAWVFFAINTSLTASIMAKIISTTKHATVLEDSRGSHSIYRTIVRAIIESSLITWVALLVYSISSTYSYTLDESFDTSNAPVISEFAFAVLPFVFGISQSLIVARIGLSRLGRPPAASKHTAIMFADSYGAEVRTELVIKGGGLPGDNIEMDTMDSVYAARMTTAHAESRSSLE